MECRRNVSNGGRRRERKTRDERREGELVDREIRGTFLGEGIRVAEWQGPEDRHFDTSKSCRRCHGAERRWKASSFFSVVAAPNEGMEKDGKGWKRMARKG